MRFAELGLLGSRAPTPTLGFRDRRACPRKRIEIPVYLTPVGYGGRHAVSLEEGQKKMHAMTRDISRNGIYFMHDQPIGTDHALITVDLLDVQPISLLLEIRRSKKLEIGYSHMSGGRFLGVAEPTDL